MKKRLMAMLLVFVMVFSMLPTSAFADGGDGGEIPDEAVEPTPTPEVTEPVPEPGEKPEKEPVAFDFMEYLDSEIPVIFQSGSDIALADYLRMAYGLPEELTFSCEPAVIPYMQYADGETLSITLTANGDYSGTATVIGEVRYIAQAASYFIYNGYDVTFSLDEAGISKTFEGTGNVSGSNYNTENLVANLQPNTTYNGKITLTRKNASAKYYVKIDSLNAYVYSDPYGVNHEEVAVSDYSIGAWTADAERSYTFKLTTGDHYGQYLVKIGVKGYATVDGTNCFDADARIITIYVRLPGQAEAEESKTGSVEAGSVTLDASPACAAYDKSIYDFSWTKSGDATVLGTERTLSVDAKGGERYVCTISRKADTYIGCTGSDAWTYTVDITAPLPLASGTCGDNLTWELDKNGVLTISGNGAMDDYDPYTAPAPWDSLSLKESVKSIVVEGGVTRVGNYALYYFQQVKNIEFAEGVESIGSGNFVGCHALKSVSIPRSVTSVYSAPGFGVNFAGTVAEWQAAVSDWSGYAYAYCSDGSYYDGGICGDNLKWLLDLEGVLTISGSGDMYDYSYTSYQDTNKAPWYGKPITSVVLKDNITGIGNFAFHGCDKIESLVIPDGVTSIGGSAFKGCTALTSLTIPTSVSFISSSAFTSCSNLLVKYKGTLDEWSKFGLDVKVQCTDGTFTGYGKCGESLAWVLDENGVLTISGTGAMPDFDDYTGTTAPWYNYRSEIKSIIIEEGVSNVGEDAFYYCEALETVSLPGSIKSIGDYAFDNCPKLTEVTIPEGVESIGYYAFAYCDSLTSVVIPDSVTDLDKNAFDNCGSLETVVIGEGISSLGGRLFSDCSKLESIHFSGNTAPTFQWDTAFPIGVTLYFPVSNYSWVKAQSNGYVDGYTWRLEGTESYAESIAKTINTYSGSESAWLYIRDDVSIESDIVTSKYLHIGVVPGVTLEFKGNLTLNGQISIPYHSAATEASYLKAGNVTVNGGLRCDQMGFADIENLVINGFMELYDGELKTSTFKWSKDSWMDLYGGKLNVSGSVTAPSGTYFINVSAGTYPDLSDAASENLWKYINYYIEADSTEAILAALALPVGRLNATVNGDIVISEDLTIDSHEEIYVSSSFVAGQDEPIGSITVAPGVKLINNGNIQLGGNLIVSDGAAFRNNRAVELDGGLIIGSRQADLSHGSNGEVYMYNSNELPEAKYLQALIDCGYRWLEFGSDYVIDCDIEISADGGISVYNGASLTVAQGARVTVKNNARGAVRVYDGTLIINGTYDGPDISVEVGNGAQVLPESKVIVVDDYGTVKYVNIRKPKATSLKLTDKAGNVLVSGSVIPVDMYEQPTYELGVFVQPAEASALANWKSSSNSVAAVDAAGKVTFLKPGSVTITATAKDGSGKSASVKFDISYKGFESDAKFSAKMDALSENGQATGIGLQLADSVKISLFAAGTTTALDSSELFYESSNTDIATVDENGIVTARKAGGSAVISAGLIGDPMNRSAKLTVKTIPAQLSKLEVLPGEEETAFKGVDANGDLCEQSGLEPVSYALYVDKIAKGEPAQTYRIMASGETAFGDTVEAKGMVTWSSSDTKLATVKENEDGSVYITVKANVDGACTITATSKDASKSKGYISVYVVERSPRVGAASVMLDTQMLNAAELAVVASYGNAITSIEYLDAGYNKTTKQYSESSGKLNMSYEADRELVVFSSDSVLKNQTVKGQLLITTEHGEYRNNLNVVIKNKAPSVTIKQSPKFNLFYLDSQNAMTFTVKNEDVLGVELVSDDFMGEWDGEKLNISYKSATPPAKPNTKATVLISLDGYAYPVSKTVTLSTASTKPSLSLSPASGVLNSAYGEEDIFISVYNKTAKADLDLSNVTASVSPASAGTVSVENGKLKFTAASGYAGGKLGIHLKDENWLSPITLSFTLKVNSNPVTLKLKSSTITVNKTFAKTYVTEIVPSHDNLDTSFISGTATAINPNSNAAKLNVWVENGKVYVQILDNRIANGIYPYTVIPTYNDGVTSIENLAAMKLTVKVAESQPKMSLSKTTLSLNRARGIAGIEEAVTELKCPEGYEVVGCEVTTPSSRIIAETEGGSIIVKLNSKSAPATGSYKLSVTPIVSDGECTAKLSALTLTVKVEYNANCSATVKASGKIDAVQRESSGITYTLTKLTNVVGNAVKAELVGQNADMFELEALDPDAKGQYRVMLRLKSGVEVSTKSSYKVQIKYTLDTGITVNSSVLTVKVSNTAIKLAASPTTQTIFQSQSRVRVVRYTVDITSPVDAEIGKISIGSVGVLQRSLVNEDTNISVRVAADGKSANIYITIKDTSALAAGKTYTLPLEIEAEDHATNIAATKLSLKLKVVK